MQSALAFSQIILTVFFAMCKKNLHLNQFNET